MAMAMAMAQAQAMSKKKTIAQMVNKAAELLQLLRRLEEADSDGYVSCVVCGVTKHYKDGMHGGHFISRARTATKLDERNVWPECARCNMPGGGHEAGWASFMVNRYGVEVVEELHALSRTTRKYYRDEVEDLINEFKERIKKEEERVVINKP